MEKYSNEYFIIQTDEFSSYFHSGFFKFELILLLIITVIFTVVPVIILYFIIFKSTFHWDKSFLFTILFLILWYLMVFYIAKYKLYYPYMDKETQKVMIKKMTLESYEKHPRVGYVVSFKDSKAQTNSYRLRVKEPLTEKMLRKPCNVYFSYYSNIIFKVELIENKQILYHINDS